MALALISLGYQIGFLWGMPYQKSLNNYLEMMNEFIMSLCIYSYMCLTDFTPPDQDVKQLSGLGVIVCVALTIGVNMLVMLYLSLRDLKNFLLERLSSAKRPHRTLAIRPLEREVFEVPFEKPNDEMMIVEDFEEEK